MTVQYIIGLDGNGAEVLVPSNYGGVGPGGKPILTPQGAPAIITATAGNAFKVVTAGTAVTAIAANSIIIGAYIVNPADAPGPLFVDMVNLPGEIAPGVNGTTEAVQPGQRWTAPGPLTNAVQVNALADNQAFTVIVF